MKTERHLILVQPEIHWNTGNVGRTCLGASAMLHLVKPLGFSLNEKHLKRAGLDYWKEVQPRIWVTFEELETGLKPVRNEIFLFSSSASKTLWDISWPPRAFLVFGCESQGLPKPLKEKFSDRIFKIPHSSKIRSLNLSTAAGIVLFESLRKTLPWEISG